ncbi:MAG: hypothetical protein AAFV33_06940 [Chloroflexota bacterium]
MPKIDLNADGELREEVLVEGMDGGPHRFAAIVKAMPECWPLRRACFSSGVR